VTTEYWQQFIGHVIENNFALRGLLGKGGFGCVFLADHVIKGTFVRRVAVKLIMAEAEQMGRQLDELIAATNLHHPSLLNCFHAGATRLANTEHLYLVMELADEGLQPKLDSSGVLPPAEVVELTRSMAQGLAYLHERGHVHRDVKPANILRVGNVWKLSDFGTVRQANDADHLTSVVVGTRDYMPSESFDGIVTPAWDVWSLGVLVLRCLTGQSPYPNASGQQLVRAVLNSEPVLPDNLPAPFSDILRGCLTRDYQRRCTAQQVVTMLGGGVSPAWTSSSPARIATQPVPARAPTVMHSGDTTVASVIKRPPAAPLRRRQIRAMIIVGGVLVLLAVAIAIAVSNSKPTTTASQTTNPVPAPRVEQKFEYPVSAIEKPCGESPRVVIENLNGAAVVTGASVETVKVSAHKTIRSYDRDDADRANQNTPVEIVNGGNEFTIRTNQNHVARGMEIVTDLEITVPAGATIVSHGSRGDVTVTKVEGSVDVANTNGAVKLQNIGGAVRLDVRDSPLVRATSIESSVELKGGARDVELSEISGTVMMNGTYTGEVDFKNIAAPVHYIGSTVAFNIEGLPGVIRCVPGELTGSNIEGPIGLGARSTNVRLTNFTGGLVAHLTGPGDVTLQPGGYILPQMEVATTAGNIDLGLPLGAVFSLRISTASGQANNEYGPMLRAEPHGSGAVMMGGFGGPQLRLSTDRGNVTVRQVASDSTFPLQTPAGK